MKKIKKLNPNEKLILKELVKNPRISDNKISEKTKIPLKTVNRKRKIFEENGLIRYYVDINNDMNGTQVFGAKQLHIIKMRYGISRKDFLSSFQHFSAFNTKHISEITLAEIDGQLALLLKIHSRIESDLIEILNVDIINELRRFFGNDCVTDIKVITINETLRVHHNYMINKQSSNMSNGVLKSDWNDSNIFVN